MICNNCKNSVPNDSEYCQFCGSPIYNKDTEKIEVSNIEKGYTYLELKEWKKAKETFDFAIINNDNKANAYIGRLLAKLKLSDLESLSRVHKKLTKFDDFKMAIKYADDNYKQQLKKYHSLIEEKIAVKKTKTKKRMKIALKGCVILFICLVVAFGGYFGYTKIISPMLQYKEAGELLDSGKYEDAIKKFESLKSYKDSKELKKEALYQQGKAFVGEGKYDNAFKNFKEIKDYKDSNKLYIDATYNYAVELYNENEFAECAKYFDRVKQYKDSEVKYLYSKAFAEFKDKSYDSALEFFDSLVKKGENLKKLKEYNFCKGITATNISDTKHYLGLCGNYEPAEKVLKNTSILEKIQGSWKEIDSESINFVYEHITIKDMVGTFASVSKYHSGREIKEEGTISLHISEDEVYIIYHYADENKISLGQKVEIINANRIRLNDRVWTNQEQIFVRTS